MEYSSDNPMHEEVRFSYLGNDYIIVYCWRDQPLGISINGEMRYFRLTHNDNYTWKANKTCISTCDPYDCFHWLTRLATTNEATMSEAAQYAQYAFHHVRPIKHKVVCDAYLEAFPYLRNTVA